MLLAPLLRDMAPEVSVFLYLFFSPICHQIPERSFFVFGHQLPVCARCTGIYTGALIGSFFARKKSFSPLFLIAAVTPLVIDGGTQLFWRESTHTLRFITGIIAGAACIFYVYAGLSSK
jgi:uncharacterized membrane protein